MSERIRHIKRGSTYRLEETGLLQWSERKDIEGVVLGAYRCEETGALWFRPMSELTDPARFEKLEPLHAESRSIWIVEAEHPWKTGGDSRAFETEAAAIQFACELVDEVWSDLKELYKNATGRTLYAEPTTPAKLASSYEGLQTNIKTMRRAVGRKKMSDFLLFVRSMEIQS